jgi:septal ring factor EnvC (AmiA/AmiB activator)
MAFAKQQPKRTLKTIIRELVDRSNSDTARIRILEQEKDIVKARADSMEQAMLGRKKQTDKALAELNAKIDKANKRILQLESTLKEIIKETKRLATTSKIKELESLVEIYNPLKSQFITKEEAEAMIERRIEKEK